MAKHISLIGMMGAGKSSVAPILAASLQRSVIEVDALIEEKEGMPIGEIFMAKGEAYFRRVEGETIARLLQEPPAVLSLGGGAFMWDPTRNLLLAETVVFYLCGTLETLCARVASGAANRPLLSLSEVSLEETMKALLEKRTPYYTLAHYRVETDLHSPEEVAQAIVIMRQSYD